MWPKVWEKGKHALASIAIGAAVSTLVQFAEILKVSFPVESPEAGGLAATAIYAVQAAARLGK